MEDPNMVTIVREISAARELLSRHGGAGSITFRIYRDKQGGERCVWQIEISEPSRLLTPNVQLDDVHPAARARK